ncbi:hypothetical protein [Coleofasciculus sp. FACHB-SPT9]|uniref:hypothetical protein n=1 Tax=Cyanophyceae TaxID=3028117 RepID=UPI00168AE898|nr:hypothetical protein [Coleofasciculus sp. FACHB-SPT9]
MHPLRQDSSLALRDRVPVKPWEQACLMGAGLDIASNHSPPRTIQAEGHFNCIRCLCTAGWLKVFNFHSRGRSASCRWRNETKHSQRYQLPIAQMRSLSHIPLLATSRASAS